MISAIFGEFGLKIMLGLEPGISSKGHMFHNMCDLLDFDRFCESIPRSKMKLHTHNGRLGDVNQQPTRAVL